MIPKKIWFIWFGDNKPNYVDFAINAFREANPDFNIELIHKTIKDIEDPSDKKYDKEIKECIYYILNKDNPRKNILYKKSIIAYTTYSKRRFIQILANIFRLKIINTYGGIYLDCDTFPVKPFDDELLNNKNFCVHNINDPWPKDCFFLGCSPGIYKPDYKFDRVYNIEKILPKNKWYIRRKRFYECRLKYIENLESEYYIEHFEDRTWQKRKHKDILTPLCKYDKEIYDT